MAAHDRSRHFSSYSHRQSSPDFLPRRAPTPDFGPPMLKAIKSFEGDDPDSWDAGGYDPDADDAARELEEAMLGSVGPGQERKGKRRVSDQVFRRGRPRHSPSESDRDSQASDRRPPHKKRRTEPDITDDLERAVYAGSLNDTPRKTKARSKGNKGLIPDDALSVFSEDSVAPTPSVPHGRKRAAAPKKKQRLTGTPALNGLNGYATPSDIAPPSSLVPLPFSQAGHVFTDAASSSAPPSPMSAAFLSLDHPLPERPKPQKLAGPQVTKRLVALEELQKKVWLSIARKDIPKVRPSVDKGLRSSLTIILYGQAYRFQAAGYNAKVVHHKRISGLVQAQARKPYVKTLKLTKEVQLKSKRLMRETLLFWKKNEKEERDFRKKAEKEAVEKAKAEEEKREAARQARKLEFLITQTELYSHFVGNKLKSMFSPRNSWMYGLT